MRNLSPNFLAAIYAQETDQVFLSLCRLSHPDWDEDLRLVADWQDVTHQGETYQAFAFQVALPDDEDAGIPVARWVADGVNREIVQQLRGITGAIQAEIKWVLASQPDTVEAEIAGEIASVDYDGRTVSGALTVEPVLEEQFGYKMLTPKTAPALF